MDRPTSFRVLTPEGNFFVVFPIDSFHCELIGFNGVAIEYFKDSTIAMFKPHGYPIVLENIEPDSFFKYCYRPDLGIYIEDDFEDEEYDMLIF